MIRAAASSRVRTSLIALAASVVLVSCGSSGTGSDTDPDSAVLTVAAAIYPIEEVVSRVGGTAVDLIALTPPGEDPHDRELTAKQLDALSNADIVFYIGEGFQPMIEKAIDSLGRNVVAIDLLDSVDLLDSASHTDATHAHDESAHDPHVWLDPANMSKMARTISDTMSTAAPSAADTFAENRDTYVAELDDLGREIDTSLTTCASRALVTAHAAFAYLAHRANLQSFSITGLNPNEEPSAKELEELEKIVRDANVTVVYYETLLPGNVAKTIADAVGVKTDLLDPVENISESDRRAGATYLTIQRENLRRLADGLRCT